ncbi:MAG: trypsin-like peptidase domain-containing protein, partial [Cyanobacteria bacterium P01_A01_bin.37]
ALDQGRVAEIWVPASKERGSGYVLCNGCLVTAYHVIKGHRNQGIQFRLLRDYQTHPNKWMNANIVWPSEEGNFDLALLKFDSDEYAQDKLVDVKQLNLSRETRYQICGFPSFRKREENGKTIIDPYAPQGTIQALTQPKKQGELLLAVDGPVPDEMEDWKGISGSVVFTDDGFWAGVVLQGPKQLKGKQLESIAIDHVINADPSFNACLRSHFRQELVCRDVERETAEHTYDLELELRALKRRKNLIEIESAENQKETAQLDWAIEERQRQLQNRKYDDRYQIEVSTLPKQRLLVLLEDIESSHSDVLWLAWQSVGLHQNWRQSLTVQDIHTLLLGYKETDRLDVFLTEIYTQLTNNQGNQHLPELKELAQVICNVDLEQAASTEQANLQQQSSGRKSTPSGDGVLLIKLDANTAFNQFPASYRVNAWMVSDRQAYEERFQNLEEGASQTIREVDEARPIVQEASVEAQTKETQAEDIKQGLSEIVASVWKKQGLKKLQPQIVFYVPVQLMEVDFHNIEYSARGDILGRKVPVFVSCVERYDDVNDVLGDYRDDWLDRWQVFKDYCDEPLSSHLQIYELQEDDPVDVTCPKKLLHWLERKDDQAQRYVAGLGFHSPYRDMIEVFKNFLLNGLPIVFWPHRMMDLPELTALQGCMNEMSSRLLPAIKKYRISGTTDDAGAVSMLLDNPYLPPPDCEFDY